MSREAAAADGIEFVGDDGGGSAPARGGSAPAREALGAARDSAALRRVSTSTAPSLGASRPLERCVQWT